MPKSPKRLDRRPVIAVLGRPGADSDSCIAALRTLKDLKLYCSWSPEVAAAAVRGARTALAVVSAGAPEAWVDEMMAATRDVAPAVPLLVLVSAGQPTPARWTQAGVATLQVPSSILALARLVTLLLEGRPVAPSR